MKLIANILILVGVGVIILIFAPAVKEEVKYNLDQALNVKYSLDTEEAGTFEKPLRAPNTDFSILIPAIGAAAPIIDNVDSQDPKSYEKALKKGVAHASGTVNPGETGNVYLFAHSTDTFFNVSRYNAVFYLIGKLKKNDEVFVYYRDRKIKYLVEEIKVVEADDTQYLLSVPGEKILTLQTCYPPGTTLKRLIVIAREVK